MRSIDVDAWALVDAPCVDTSNQPLRGMIMQELQGPVQATTPYYPEGSRDLTVAAQHVSDVELVEVRKGRLVFELPAHGHGNPIEASPHACALCGFCDSGCSGGCLVTCRTCTCPPPPTCVCTFNCVITT